MAAGIYAQIGRNMIISHHTHFKDNDNLPTIGGNLPPHGNDSCFSHNLADTYGIRRKLERFFRYNIIPMIQCLPL